jgi:WD40 repeat protein/serine/threonine protein kinase
MDPSDSDRNPVEELAEEFALRYRRGERPPLSEYTARYPQWADQIRALFPALVVMERVRPGPEASAGPAPGPRPDERPPERLGDYRILREVGRGGMGRVYEAEQESLGRHVALKVLPVHALPDPRHLQRFQREARAAARLHHTNIVPVHGVGEQDGLHYYVMQFIPGQGLDQVLAELRRLRRTRHGTDSPSADEAPAAAVARSLLTWPFVANSLSGAAAGACPSGGSSSASVHLPGQAEGSSLSEAGWPYWHSVARIGLQVSEALAYASSQGILHRDIKPSNLLLDTRGTVWVTDFGLAKAETDHDNLTQPGDIVGTLRYMAPERFQGQADVRSDLYALGLALYELLTLRPAFDDADRNKLLARVLHEQPPRPRKLNPAVPRDLETIVLKATAREPVERYQTPAEMAEDLQRFLDDRPIRARRLSLVQRGWRWARRNPWVASLSAAVLVLLIAGATVSTVAAIRIDAARDEADGNARDARRAEQRAADEAAENRRRLVRTLIATGARHLDEGDVLASFPWFVEALKRDDDPAREEMHRIRLGAVLRQGPKLVGMWFHEHEVFGAFSPDGRLVVTASHDGTARVWDAATGKAVTPPLKHPPGSGCAAFSPDGRRVATGGGNLKEGSARVWDAATGEPVTPSLPHKAWVSTIAFSPDGRRVVTAGKDGTARVWDASTGEPVTPSLDHQPEVFSAVFSPDGRRLVTAGLDGTARVWEAATGQPAYPPLKHPGALWQARFSSDGERLVTASGGRTVRVWDAATGEQLLELKHAHMVRYAEFSPDNRLVVTASDDCTARVWNAATGAPVTPPLQHRLRVTRASFSPDGRRVLTASMDTTARVWDAATGKELTPPMRHVYGVPHASFSPEGNHVLTASLDQTVRLWDASVGELTVTPLPHALPASHPRSSFSPDGRRVICAHADGTIRVWDTATGQGIGAPIHHENLSWHFFSPDGRLVVTASTKGTVRVWNALTGEPVTPWLAHKARVMSAVFNPDGSQLITASQDRTARVWDVATGRPLSPPLLHPGEVGDASWSPDGRLVVTCSANAAWVWDVAAGVHALPPLEHRGAILHACFSPDGSRVVTTSADSTARVWDAATGAPVTPPLQHGNFALEAAFSPNGTRVVTASADGTARVWDAVAGKPVTPPMQPGGLGGYLGWVSSPSFSPDGRCVLARVGSTLHVWDAATGEPLCPPLKHELPVEDTLFSPDGRRVLSVGEDQALRVWSLAATDWPLDDLVLLGQLLTGRQIDDTGALVPLEPVDGALSPHASAREGLRCVWETLRARHPGGFAPAR